MNDIKSFRDLVAWQKAMDLADRINVLELGRCIASGTPSAIRDNPEVRKSYLGAD